MTRINLVHPSKLADQHLFAEWREIKHIPAFLKQLLDKGQTESEIKAKIPKEFTLNKGHKYFFVDKLDFLNWRFVCLTMHLRIRKFELEQESIDRWFDWIEKAPDEFFGNYEPDQKALDLSNERIIERISQKPDWYRYKGEVKDVEFFRNLLIADV